MRKGKRPHGWGQVKRRNGHLHVLWTDETGTPRSKSVSVLLGVRPDEVTEGMAQDAVDQLIAAKKLGRALLPSPTRMTVTELLDLYLEAKADSRAIRSMRSEAQAVIQWIGTELLATLAVQRYLRRLVKAYEKRFAKATVKTRLGLLAAAWRWAFFEEELPVPKPPVFPEIEGQNIRRVEIKEHEFWPIHRALRALDPADDIAELLWWVGFRASEACELEWDRIDRDAWRIRLDEIDTKTKQARWRPVVEPELLALLERRWAQRSPKCPNLVFHRQGKPVTYGWFRDQWAAGCKQVGIGNRRPHDFRRSGYSRLVNAGVDLFTAMELMGHKSLTTARRYVLGDPQRQVAGLEKVQAHRKSSKLRAAGSRGEGEPQS